PLVQPLVDLDDVQRSHALEQRRGQRAEPTADLDERVVRPRIDRIDESPDHGRVVQKMLPEALARRNAPRALQRPAHAAPRALRASSRPTRSAASRLSGRARPVPASGSAVPWSTDVRTIGSPSVTFTTSPNATALSGARP